MRTMPPSVVRPRVAVAHPLLHLGWGRRRCRCRGGLGVPAAGLATEHGFVRNLTAPLCSRFRETHPPPSMSGPLETLPSCARRSREGGLDSGCATSSPHQPGTSNPSNASPGISWCTLRPKLPDGPLRTGGQIVGEDPKGCPPALNSAPQLQYYSGSELSTAASDLEPPFGGSFRGFGGAPPALQEDGEGEEDLQNTPDSPPPPLPKLKFRKKFFQSIVQSVRGILQLKEGGASGGGPTTQAPRPRGPTTGSSHSPQTPTLCGAPETTQIPGFPLSSCTRGIPSQKQCAEFLQLLSPEDLGGGVLGAWRTPETAVGGEEVSPPAPSRQQQCSPGVVPAPRGGLGKVSGLLYSLGGGPEEFVRAKSGFEGDPEGAGDGYRVGLVKGLGRP
ncbi:uncharacterized protein LOC116438799 isoform X1 [Corvus moneduloides]|uniref:uncharacterized protein LOC116438799 isoform X1 n=2 Tax=Corvus moneduloides TaxID=1196302 RepID=UPI001362B154|nr:uncharacterized protein LOC116438799 isoform X1 [Corvus moneduloides]